MATKWEPCGANFDIGDVVRWTEGVWYEGRRRRKRKATRVGSWLVTGQVLTQDPKDFVHVSVLKCEMLEIHYGMVIEPLKKNHLIKRKRATLAKGRAERLAAPAEAPPRRLSTFQHPRKDV